MYSSTRSLTYSRGKFISLPSDLILEAPLEITIDGHENTLIMFTPGLIRELVTGFIFTEGLIEGLSDIKGIIISSTEKGDGEQVIEAKVSLATKIPKRSGVNGKRVSYSSCGICGKDNYFSLKTGLKRVKSRHKFSMRIINSLPDRIVQYQPLYQKTGGAHAALLFDNKGNPVLYCEDMGRHNALDKVIGASLIKGISLMDKILVSSGRASLEMILKTARAGIPVFVAISRPTSKAVEAAKFYNITLIDMAKGSNRIYSHARRIEGF
ncbi:MAG: formate dehydrogenase accessory sulfurtransferase FdhD [Pseudomonadota bacterium]